MVYCFLSYFLIFVAHALKSVSEIHCVILGVIFPATSDDMVPFLENYYGQRYKKKR
jgi:hypothetical protein